jgi:hypothetical protein
MKSEPKKKIITSPSKNTKEVGEDTYDYRNVGV